MTVLESYVSIGEGNTAHDAIDRSIDLARSVERPTHVLLVGPGVHHPDGDELGHPAAFDPPAGLPLFRGLRDRLSRGLTEASIPVPVVHGR